MEQKVWKLGKVVLLLSTLLVLTPMVSPAQEYPTKPINIVVVWPPGGTTDISTRVLASKAEKFLGQPFVISNKGGGGGSVGLATAKNEKPDGYHLVACTSIGLTYYPTFQTLPYTHQDYVPIMHFAEAVSGLVVKSDSPWKTLKDLVGYARKNPGKVTYGTNAVNSPQNMIMEYIAKKEGIKWTHIPFPGGAPNVIGVLGGHTTAMAGSTEWVPHVREGTLRLLAAFSETRIQAFPDVPAVRELGYDISSSAMFMIAAPKGTPASIIEKLDDAFHKAMDDPEFIRTIEKMEMKVSYRNSQDTEKCLNDIVRWLKEVVMELKIPKEPEKK